MSETTATCMARKGGCDGSVRMVRRPLVAASVAVVGALVAAQAAVLLLRPRDGVITPDPVDLGAFFTDAQLERAVDFRGPQLALYGATIAVQAGVLVLLVARRGPLAPRLRRTFRRPVLAAGGDRRRHLGRCSRSPCCRSTRSCGRGRSTSAS